MYCRDCKHCRIERRACKECNALTNERNFMCTLPLYGTNLVTGLPNEMLCAIVRFSNPGEDCERFERNDVPFFHRSNTSARLLMVMKNEGIETVDQLCAFSQRDLMKLPNFGITSLREVETKLAALGLKLRQETT